VQVRTESGVAVLLTVLVIGLVLGAVVGSAFDGGHAAFAGGHR
jgi:hypothetical protein